VNNPGWVALLLHYLFAIPRGIVQQLLDIGRKPLIGPLQSSANNGRTVEEECAFAHPEIAAMFKAEAMQRAKCVAFAMGQLERLGAGSRVQELDAGVVRMVLERVVLPRSSVQGGLM